MHTSFPEKNQRITNFFQTSDLMGENHPFYLLSYQSGTHLTPTNALYVTQCLAPTTKQLCKK